MEAVDFSSRARVRAPSLVPVMGAINNLTAVAPNPFRAFPPIRREADDRGHQRLRSPAMSPQIAKRKRRIECVPNVQDLTPIRRESKRRKRSKSGEGGRKWTFSSNDLSSCEDRFMIVSYNILGDDNASKHSDLYEQVDPEDLNWETRMRRICREIRRYEPGILCLQEVDHFDDLAASLRKHGFAGVYKGRTGEANDGCAIFWRQKQFFLLHHEDIEFEKFGLRNNVANLCVLKMHPDRSSEQCETCEERAELWCSRTVVVGNIHVLFNPKRGDIKLGQMRLLLERAHILAQKYGNCPVVIAGDLNSMPQSALYQFLSTSELNILLHDRREVSAQTAYSYRNQAFGSHYDNKQRYYSSFANTIYRWSEEEIYLAVGKRGVPHLRHPLRLCSAYAGVPGNSRTRDYSGEPLVTSYHSKFMGTVDYIWHSLDLLPVRVLDTLPVDLLKKTGGLPCEKWGSDHLALVCELAFTSRYLKRDGGDGSTTCYDGARHHYH